MFYNRSDLSANNNKQARQAATSPDVSKLNSLYFFPHIYNTSFYPDLYEIASIARLGFACYKKICFDPLHC